jgi:glycerol-3-phosphate dehydrogenase
MLSRRETLEQLPGLNADGLLGSALYFDAQVEFAERLVLENVLAASERGAEVYTYEPVTRKHLTLASVIVNASGPWVDDVFDEVAFESPKLIGGTKGSHIVVAPFAGAPSNAIYLEAQSDKRPFFIIPWNRNYLIGTTDVRFEDDPDEVRSELWEIDYLLAETNRAFPEARLMRDHVLYTYSGVRPLPVTGEKDEQSITRRHFIREHPRMSNLLSIVGGKLTTYRSLAEECVDLIFRKLGRPSPPCTTAREVLPGAVNFSSTESRLFRIYGSRASQVTQLNEDPFTAEILFAFKHEFAKTLADCFLRRTMIGLDSDRGLSHLTAAAEIGQRHLGWTEERARHEIEAYRLATDCHR